VGLGEKVVGYADGYAVSVEYGSIKNVAVALGLGYADGYAVSVEYGSIENVAVALGLGNRVFWAELDIAKMAPNVTEPRRAKRNCIGFILCLVIMKKTRLQLDFLEKYKICKFPFKHSVITMFNCKLLLYLSFQT